MRQYASPLIPLISRRRFMTGLVGGALMIEGLGSCASTTATGTPGGVVTRTPTPAARLGTIQYTYEGHSRVVLVVAWSPDSKRIVSGSIDRTLQVWDALDGNHVFTYNGHTDSVTTSAWSPDGTRIASGADDRTVQVWNAHSGTLMRSCDDSPRLCAGGFSQSRTEQTRLRQFHEGTVHASCSLQPHRAAGRLWTQWIGWHLW